MIVPCEFFNTVIQERDIIMPIHYINFIMIMEFLHLFVNTTFSHTLNTAYIFTFYHVNVIPLYLAYLYYN